MKKKKSSYRDVKWKTKDGKILRIRQMTDDHLLNAHRYLRRLLEEEKNQWNLFGAGGMLGPSEDSIAFEHASEAEAESFEDRFKMEYGVTILRKEIEYRKLEPLPLYVNITTVEGKGVIKKMVTGKTFIPDPTVREMKIVKDKDKNCDYLLPIGKKVKVHEHDEFNYVITHIDGKECKYPLPCPKCMFDILK